MIGLVGSRVRGRSFVYKVGAGALDHLIQPEMPTPMAPSSGPWTGEKKLMAAVLWEAVSDYLDPEIGIANGLWFKRPHAAPDYRERKTEAKRADAAAWLFDPPWRATWPFTCANICDVLGIDLGALRVRLLAEAERRRAC